uniref:Tautomerase cis-CaaD-like domain-containing protein n=1 Tax=Bionectria ochroleuca TaxID=29856 RepID=A0A8H7N4Z4_BIOOC
MPLWNIFHTEGIFESQEVRSKLAADITSLYTSGGLPSFYVVVHFIPLPPTNVFVAAEARINKPFVRFVVEHMAVHREEGPEGFAERFSDRIKEALRPYIAEKGYDWEITIADTPRDFWRFNGIVPPPWRSEAERLWAQTGRPIEWKTE